jgi:hypothetical protein
MPRDAGGNYTLPAGNPVVTGTVITSTWANPTMGDIGNEISNSLSRDGQGGMRAPLQFFDGTKNDPGITFTLEPTAGVFRDSNGIVGVASTGKAIALFKGATGNVETFADEPIEDNDLSQKVWVEAMIASAIAAKDESDWPIGAKFIGPDPNGVKVGSWTQLPEGTFLMNTVAGADPSGGSNDAVNIAHGHSASQPAHDHTATQGTHSHSQPTSEPNSNQGGVVGNSSRSAQNNIGIAAASAGAIDIGDATPTITVVNSGVSGTDLNKPLYVGVEVWERTA